MNNAKTFEDRMWEAGAELHRLVKRAESLDGVRDLTAEETAAELTAKTAELDAMKKSWEAPRRAGPSASSSPR